MAPTSVRMIATTPAKIGRSMKKWDRRMMTTSAGRASAGYLVGRLLGGRRDFAVLGLDLLPGPGPLQPLDDDAICGCQPGANDAQAFDDRAELDAFDAHCAVVRDRGDDLVRLIERNGAVGHQQCIMRAAEEAKATEESWGEQSILILENGAAT